jgi:periplasmic divalent cation tolerance protein
MSHIVALMTASGLDEARAIASTLVEERLAACCNIVGGVESIYRWGGKVESAREVLVVVKTTADLQQAVAERIEQLHSYDLPEFVVLPVVGGSERYLAWLDASVEDGPSTSRR